MRQSILQMLGILAVFLGAIALRLFRDRLTPVPDPQPDPPSPPEPTPEPVDDIGHKMLAALNEFRKRHSKDELTWNDILGKIAKDHSDVQAKNHKMSHMLAGDGSPMKRFREHGYHYSNMGENVAWDQADVAAVMKAWEWSLPHRINMLGSFTEFGGWMTDIGGGPYWTQCFGSSSGERLVMTVPMKEIEAFMTSHEGMVRESPEGGWLTEKSIAARGGVPRWIDGP